MFVFFSNRLGCFGSLLVSVVLTLILLLILGVLWIPAGRPVLLPS